MFRSVRTPSDMFLSCCLEIPVSRSAVGEGHTNGSLRTAISMVGKGALVAFVVAQSAQFVEELGHLGVITLRRAEAKHPCQCLERAQNQPRTIFGGCSFVTPVSRLVELDRFKVHCWNLH